jgi:hypothetical protein
LLRPAWHVWHVLCMYYACIMYVLLARLGVSVPIAGSSEARIRVQSSNIGIDRGQRTLERTRWCLYLVYLPAHCLSWSQAHTLSARPPRVSHSVHTDTHTQHLFVDVKSQMRDSIPTTQNFTHSTRDSRHTPTLPNQTHETNSLACAPTVVAGHGHVANTPSVLCHPRPSFCSLIVCPRVDARPFACSPACFIASRSAPSASYALLTVDSRELIRQFAYQLVEQRLAHVPLHAVLV